MTACPRCGTALKDEYGMSQCPGCGAFSFIDMDGQAVIQSDASDEGRESVAAPVADAVSVRSSVQTEERDPSPAVGGAAALPEFPDPIEALVEVEKPQSFDPFDPFEPAPVEPEAAGPVFGPADDPLNLNEFANSEVSSAKDGPLLFRVLISGIDTKEIRDSIREVLEDPRFAWDSSEIVSKISKGHLAIKDLSPVKASILITRIKRLPVQIRWEQYAISQGQA